MKSAAILDVNSIDEYKKCWLSTGWKIESVNLVSKLVNVDQKKSAAINIGSRKMQPLMVDAVDTVLHFSSRPKQSLGKIVLISK